MKDLLSDTKGVRGHTRTVVRVVVLDCPRVTYVEFTCLLTYLLVPGCLIYHHSVRFHETSDPRKGE